MYFDASPFDLRSTAFDELDIFIAYTLTYTLTDKIMTTEESNITIYDPLTAGNKVSIDADTKTETNVVVDKVSIEDEIEKLQNKKK
jgi:hypothetical protein